MQYAATISDATRRLGEASALFRYKSRAASEMYDEISGRWNDARARQFSVRHLQPQSDYMQQGGRLCGLTSELADGARNSAQNTESELSGFYSTQGDGEASIAAARRDAQSATDLASHAVSSASRIASELQNIQTSISIAASDPGW